MDLKVYSKELEDLKNIILNVSKNALNIKSPYFYKERKENKSDLQATWDDEFSLNEPIKNFFECGTKKFLEEQLKKIYFSANVNEKKEAFHFSVVVESLGVIDEAGLLKLKNYIHKYKNARSVCDSINIYNAVGIKLKTASVCSVGKVISVYPKPPKNIQIGALLNSTISTHLIIKQEIKNV